MTKRQWPRRRGSRTAFIDKHGEDRADRFLTAFHEGDPIADAVFSSSEPTRVMMSQLRTALKQGRATVGDAPEIFAFISDLTASVEDVDWERVERGRRVYLSIPVLTHSVALGPGSLTNTYSSPAIASVLVATGRLVDGAVRRLLDTRNWTYHLYFADALRPGHGGFEHTGMVRAMHAFSRAQHLKRGQGTADFGLPINAVDMVRTWLDFTYVPYRALAAMGYDLTTAQIQDVYYFWRVVGRLLGIPADLLAGIEDHVSAEPLVQAIDDVAGTPDDNSRALVNALVGAVAKQMSMLMHIPEPPLVELTEAQIRMIHGDEQADQMQIPRRSIQVSAALQVPVVQQRFAFLQQLPHELEKEIATNEAILHQMLESSSDGQSAYETAPAAGLQLQS